MRTPFFSAPSASAVSPWSANNLFTLSCANVNAPPTYVSRLSSKSSRVSSRNGFLDECLTLYTANFNLRLVKLSCDLISAKAFSIDALLVSEEKASRIASGLVERILDMTD